MRHTEKTHDILDFHRFMKIPMASNGLAIGKESVGITNLRKYNNSYTNHVFGIFQ
jgi:hypothetical protein